MDRDTLRIAAHGGAKSTADPSGAPRTSSASKPTQGAWLIRAVVIAYLVTNGVVAYLLFAAA